jgi:hypothetical protein
MAYRVTESSDTRIVIQEGPAWFTLVVCSALISVVIYLAFTSVVVLALALPLAAGLLSASMVSTYIGDRSDRTLTVRRNICGVQFQSKYHANQVIGVFIERTYRGAALALRLPTGGIKTLSRLDAGRMQHLADALNHMLSN